MRRFARARGLSPARSCGDRRHRGQIRRHLACTDRSVDLFTRGVAMSRFTRRWLISVVTALLAAPALGISGAESQTPRTLRPPAPPVVAGGIVFVGGYFYDPAFG